MSRPEKVRQIFGSWSEWGAKRGKGTNKGDFKVWFILAGAAGANNSLILLVNESMFHHGVCSCGIRSQCVAYRICGRRGLVV